MFDKKISVTVQYPNRAAMPPTVMRASELPTFLAGITIVHHHMSGELRDLPTIKSVPVDEISP